MNQPEALSCEERVARVLAAIESQRAGYREQIAAVVATLKEGREKLAKLDEVIDAELAALPAHRSYGRRGRGAWLREASRQLETLNEKLGEMVGQVRKAGEVLTR